MKKLTALLLAVLMVFTLAACHNKDDGAALNTDGSIAGSYVLVSVLENGEEVDLAMFAKLQFTLNEDGTGTYGNGSMNIDITWTQNGEAVTFTAVGDGPADPLELIANGDILIANDNGSQMTFQKQ